MKLLNAISILVVLSGISCFTFAADAPKYLADRHAAKRIPCEACHGKGTPKIKSKWITASSVMAVHTRNWLPRLMAEISAITIRIWVK